VGLRENRAAPSKAAGARRPQSSKDALQEAFRTQGFWLLTIGFFVCGFHVTFIGLHLPSYISDNSIGLSFFGRPISAIELGGWAIGLVGLFNIVGSLLWGWLGGHHLRKDMLYRVPEIVTRGRFPDGGESDSTWRTQEARHVGSDTI